MPLLWSRFPAWSPKSLMEYKEEDFLQLSGLQHFKFCRRRWALIHIENQWEENYRTIDGAILHQNAHDTEFLESRGDRFITRGVSIYSAELGGAGRCDVLEYHRGSTGVAIGGKDGLWQPFPVEYKRGRPREDTGDALQLCGQAMCLETMLCCDMPEGALYYGEIRRRERVAFTPELRAQVRQMLEQMHDLYQRGYTPKVRPTKSCNACSMKELCLPKLMKNRSVSAYLKAAMEEMP